MKRLTPSTILLMCCIPLVSCGKYKLNADEIERNRLFAEILNRSDRRILGEDDFFPRNLKTSVYPEVQEWCAMALGRIGNPSALPWLYDALHSPYAAVRAAAAFAIGETEDREILKDEFRRVDARASAELTDLLNDPSIQVQMRAVEALGKVGLHADAVVIARRLESFRYDGSLQKRTYLSLAITALMRLNDPIALSILQKLATETDPEIQWRSANALYRMRAKSARATFLKLLESAHPDVLAHAARGLGICEDRTLAAFLTPLLGPFRPRMREPLPLSVRVFALQTLGNLKDPNSVSAIRDALQTAPVTARDPDQTNFAAQAATTLGMIGAAEGESALLPLLKIPGTVANSAIVALAKVLRHSERFFELVDPGQFTTPEGERAWAHALGELGGNRAVQELTRMLVRLTDEHASPADVLVVPAVLESLRRAEAPALQEILLPFLSSRDGVILRAAVDGYKPRPGTLSPWAPLVYAYSRISASKDVEAKVAVLNALDPWVREKEVEAALRAALKDRQRNARITAARLLRKAGASDVPLDPGPSETTTTLTTYDLLAASRKDRTVAILDTVRGSIEIELFREDAPLTVDNFVTLARHGYFDGLSFMRVVPYFVIQGGDPRNDMEGGPGYTIRCEINMRPYEIGSVGMALSGKDTGGSQFFITLAAQPHLDGGYTCFGRVISGMSVAKKIVAGDRILRVSIQEDSTALDYRRY